MKKLLIATTNSGKLAEIKQYLSDLPVSIVGLKDVGITDRVEETGNTFEENAILKAKFYAHKSGLLTLADDGGFEIDALHGEPGVRSHRWIHSDREDSDEERNEYTMKRMKDVPLEKRGAQLRLVLALVSADTVIKIVEEAVRGIIPLSPSPKKQDGFPYRSLLFFPEIQKFYIDLSVQEHEKYNHRAHALIKLKPYILDQLKTKS